MKKLKIGTCSWKYDSWRGIIYPESSEINYLAEYSKHFKTAEIDQWFWSLFPPDKALLPDVHLAEEYADSVSDDFLFTIKVPNSITLTHFYDRSKKGPMIKNPYFLSEELFNEFLKSIEPLKEKTGCLMFQFEYLNKGKMSSQGEFRKLFSEFREKLAGNIPPLALEIRNLNYLNDTYFKFLNELQIAHVFLEGYYLPPAAEIYSKFKAYIKDFAVIRLHGPDRQEMEKISGKNWDRIYVNRDRELERTAEMIMEIQMRKVDLFVNVNNHFEGSAPLTIKKLEKLIQTKKS